MTTIPDMTFMRVVGGMLVGRYLRRRRLRRGGPNVGRNERWASGLLGLALTALTMRSGGGRLRRLLGLWLAGALTKRGMTGRCGVYQAMRVSSV